MASSMVREGLVVPFLRLSYQGLVLSPRTGGAWPHATSEPTLSARVARESGRLKMAGESARGDHPERASRETPHCEGGT